MRITNKMMTTSFTRSLENLFTDLNKLRTQVDTQRKFSKSSEDTAAAVSAYAIRKNLSRAQDYQENIAYAKDFLSNSESVLTLVNEPLQDATASIVAAVNAGPISSEERAIFATQLGAIRDQLLQTMNADTTGVYIFGGTTATEKPFGVATDPSDPSGRTYLTYHGKLVKDLTSAEAAELSKKGLTIDLGMGLSTLGPSSPNEIDPSSVFTYSITGLEVMTAGSSTVAIEGGTSEVVPNNLYDQLNRMVEELQKGDGDYSNDTMEALFGKLQKSSSSFLSNITNVGAKSSYLNFMEDRYDTQILSLQERQNHVEVADPALTLISFSTQKVAYETALRMGADLIQPSLFNFLD